MARRCLLDGEADRARELITQSYDGIDLDSLSSTAALLVPLAEAELALSESDYEGAISHLNPLIARMQGWGVRFLLRRGPVAQGKGAASIRQD